MVLGVRFRHLVDRVDDEAVWLWRPDSGNIVIWCEAVELLESPVKHRSRVAIVPSKPKLRQMILFHVAATGGSCGKEFQVKPAGLGENMIMPGRPACPL